MAKQKRKRGAEHQRANRRSRSFDFIVVGAGTSGCTLAGRLARHGSTLLLETGGPDSGVQQGLDVGELVSKPDNMIRSWNSPITVKYQTAPQEALGKRSVTIHQGVVRGGSHSINSMIYVRGNRRDYDAWAQLGNEGWSYDEVLPYFKASEHFDGRPLSYDSQDLAYHGVDGPVHVRPLPNPTPVAGAFIAAAADFGFGASRPSWDFNGRQQENGAGLYQVTVTADGRRASTAAAFLDGPDVPSRLEVVTHATVTRILLEDRRAVGVECIRSARTESYRAKREVILCAGAFGSAKLLMLSGIGPADHLRASRITPVADVPGVGENLHDHLMILLFHEARRDPGQSSFTAEAGLFMNTIDQSGASAPDLQYHVLGRMPQNTWPLPKDYFLICPTLCKPHSRGQLRLDTRKPGGHPILHPAYLERESDLQVLAYGIDLTRKLVLAPALRDFYDGSGAVFGIGPHGSIPLPASAQAIRDFIRATATTVWHPAGTCKMGRDRLAVVDPQLKVHGVEGLRVADASIVPSILSGNINAACIMIAEKCADLIVGRRHGLVGLPTAGQGNGATRLRPGTGEAGREAASREPVAASFDRAAVIQRLGQAAIAVSGSGIRSWGRAAEIWARAIPRIVRTIENSASSGGRPDTYGALLDELRSCLRELAELPAQEARYLQAELDGAVRALLSTASSDGRAGSDPYRRWWEVKP